MAGGNLNPEPTATVAALPPLPPDTWRQRYPGLARFTRRPLAIFSLFVIILLFLVAAIGPEVWTYQYDEQLANTAEVRYRGNPQPPSAMHPAGTDFLGRDLAARLLVGARISLAVGVVSMVINLLIGVGIGVLAAWFGGWVDTVLMRVVDILYSIPLLLIVILLQVFLKPVLVTWIGATADVPVLMSPDLISIYLALGITNWLVMARLARGEVMTQLKRDYVAAAWALGVPPFRILWRHILPNTFGVLAVAATLAIPEAIFIESFLAFVGLGVSAPAASWGSLADDGRRYLSTAPWLIIYPAMAISITMLAFNLFGDGLRDALDPRQRE